MTNFNFKFMDTFLRYMDSNGNTLDLNGSQIDTDLDERTEQNTNAVTALQHYFDSISIKESASGALVSVADGSDGIPVKQLVVNIELIQEGTGDPSPENVRPISGRTEVNVWRDATHDTSADPAITIQIGQTVYGGSLNVTTGVLTVNRKIVDLGTLTWSYSAERDWFNIPSAQSIQLGIKPPINDSTVANVICSNYPTVSNTYMRNTDPTAIACSVNATGFFIIRDTAYTDPLIFKNAMSGVQLCYELVTPFTITLTPAQLTTLLGQNYIWADSGNVAVNYVADTKLYIDSANTQNDNRETEKSDVIKEEIKDDNIEEKKEIE